MFNKEEAPYVITKPIHESQKVKKHDENGLLITIEVFPNIELEKVILSYGSGVKVIGPKSFKDKIKKTLLHTTDFYQ